MTSSIDELAMRTVVIREHLRDVKERTRALADSIEIYRCELAALENSHRGGEIDYYA